MVSQLEDSFLELELRKDQYKKKSGSGYGMSSGEEEDYILVEEASENGSDRENFICHVFGFL